MRRLIGASGAAPHPPGGHRPGGFLGIGRDGMQVATGRAKPDGHVGIASPSTRPGRGGHGHGHARRPLRSLAAGIRGRGEIPVLHVAAGHDAAIATYRWLGFATRREMALTLLVGVPSSPGQGDSRT